jgi:hypothetical protein
MSSEFWEYAESIDAIRGRGKLANALNKRSDLSFTQKLEILKSSERREDALTLAERGEASAKRLLGKE